MSQSYFHWMMRPDRYGNAQRRVPRASQSYFHWMMRPDSIFYIYFTTKHLNTKNNHKNNHIRCINQVF